MEIFLKYRWAILVAIIGFCIYGAGYISSALQPNNNLEVWFDNSDPTLEAYYNFQEEFGNDRIITLAFKEENGVLTQECLQKIDRLGEELEKVDGIKGALSIANAKDFRKLVNGQKVSYQFTSWFNEDFDNVNEELNQELLSSSLYTNRLINENGDVTLLIIQLESFDLVQHKIESIVNGIKDVCNEVLGKNNYHLSGGDVINFGLNELTRKDFIKFTGLSYLVMFVMIAFFYRRLIYVLLSFLIAFSTIWLTFSTYGYLGFGFNIFTVMTPTLIIVISLMISMHILNEFESSNTSEFENKKAKTIVCLKAIVKPCFFAAVTTMVGFLSLLTSSTAIIKEFGWLTALGCFLAFIMAFVWSSVVLPFVKVNAKEKKLSNRLGESMFSFAGFILRRSKAFILLSLILFILAILGIMNIKIDMNTMEYFPDDNAVLIDHRFMEENWGDYYPIDIVLEAADSKKITDRDIISAMIAFDDQIVEKQLGRSSFSYVKIMESYAQVRYKEKLGKVIYSPILNKQFSNSFERLVESESNSLVTEDEKKARMTIIGSIQSVRALEASIEELNAVSDSIFSNSAQMEISGYPSLFIRIMNASFESMRSSLLVVSILVFFIMLILLRNLKIAIIAIIVNLFPVMVMFGFLGFSNINLDLATCTIAAIILGVAIDDTIHILYRYQQERKNGSSVEDALMATHFHIGRVVVLTSIVLIVGFSILMLASLKTVFYFGLLSTIAVVAVMYGDLILLTLLLKKIKD